MISANQVEFSSKKYLKDAILHFWGHQTIYLIPLFFVTVLTIFIHTIVPFSAVTNTIGVFLFGWYCFFVMELTFSSTQEKYTPKKYLTSGVLSGISFFHFLKHYSGQFILALGIGILFWIYNDMTDIATASTIAAEKKPFLERLIRHTFFDSVPRGMATLIIVATMSNVSPTDFFVTTRMMGVTGETPDYELNRSAILNGSCWKKIFFLTFGLFIFKPLFLIFAPFVILIFVIAISFYSMDIFGVDKMKKIKETEQKKVENFNTVPELS